MVTTLAEATLLKLMRVGGFRREPVLGDAGVELVLYSRDTPTWLDRVVVYSDRAARAYRTPRHLSTSADLVGPDAAEPPEVVLQVALTDVVSVVNTVLSWPVTGGPDQ